MCAPTVDSHCALGVHLGITKDRLCNNKAWSKSSQLLSKDDHIVTDVIIIASSVFNVEINSVALPLSNLSSKLLGGIRGAEPAFPSLSIHTIRVATDRIDNFCP